MESAQFKAHLANAYTGKKQSVFISAAPNDFDEIWAIGDVAFVVPVVPDDADPELSYALTLRRHALLTGRCDGCDAVPGETEVYRRHGMNLAPMTFPHRRNCPASDQSAGPLLEAHQNVIKTQTMERKVQDVMVSTGDKFRSEIPSNAQRLVDAGAVEWGKELLDRELNAKPLFVCHHLISEPVQTWCKLLGDNRWHCQECWGDVLLLIRSGEFCLPLVEDFTCDYCRRYCRELSPIRMRVGIHLLQGGLCTKCKQKVTRLESS
ncbi:hypothetical protein [Nocardia tengchongensis]